MQWIKRNLFLVVGAVVALALLGVAGFYLYSKVQQDRAVTEDLGNATQELERLAKRDPYPNPENIKSAKDEGKRLQNFLGEVEKHFIPAPYPEMANNMEFRTYLDNTIAGLRGDAHRAGVEIPTNYWFTFAAQKSAVTFSANALQPLATQLADLRTLCNVLFDAKVNALAWLKRVPVDSQDSLGSQDYLNAKGSTNAYGVTMPYEVAFQGFSSQLATVLENLAKLPQCYIVTNMVVEPASSAPAGTEGTTPMYTAAPMDANTLMRNRYGLGRYGGRYGPAMQQPVVPVVQPRGPSAMLDEKQLRFILSVQAVKLKPAAPAKAAAPVKPQPQPQPAP